MIIPLNYENRWACFDPDTLRWAVVWQAPAGQPPITYDSMAAISFPNKKAKAKTVPQLRGEILLSYPKDPSGKPRKETRTARTIKGDLPIGPAVDGRWIGISLSGKAPILHYSLGEQEIREIAGTSEQTTFTRLVTRTNSSQNLLLSYTTHGNVSSQDLGPITNTSAKPVFPESYLTENPEAKSQGPYSIRNITVPNSKRAIRATDLAFLSNGTALLTTLDGDVWRIDAIEEERSQWTRVATGLYEPMSLAITPTDQIFVLGRDQITELVDENGDLHFDLFLNASDLFQQTLHTRDYATSLEVGSDGAFYLAKGGINEQKRKSPLSEHSAHRGAILRITDEKIEVLAEGLRLPYVGLRQDGAVFASDQQGQHIPSTPIHLIANERPFLGFPETNHHHEQTITEPLFYYPYQDNRSGAAFATTSALAFPDLPDQFLQVSWNGSLFPINTPEDGQPFSWKLPLQLDFPSLNGASHPQSGKLYAVGLGISGYLPTTPHFIGLAAIEQSSPFPSPIALDVQEQAITVTFNRPLTASETVTIDEAGLRLFNVKRTPNYGSGHFRWDGEAGEHLLQPKSLTLSPDRTTFSLTFESLHRSDILDLPLKISSSAITDTIHLYTRPQHLPLASKADIDRIEKAHESTSALVLGDAQLGKPLFTQYACIGCHSLTGEKLVGPPLNKAGEHSEAFLRESILLPSAQVTEGYEPSMPSFAGVIPEQSLLHLLEYLKTLK